MSSDRIKIRVRSGQNEAEIEAEMGQMREAIALIPEITSKFPQRPGPSLNSPRLPSRRATR